MSLPEQFIMYALIRMATVTPNVELYRRIQEHYMDQYTVIFSDAYTISHSTEFEEIVKIFAEVSAVTIFDVKQKLSKETNCYVTLPKNSVIYIKDNLMEDSVKLLRSHKLWYGRIRALVLVTNEIHVLPWLRTLWEKTRAVDVVVSVLQTEDYFTWYPYTIQECTNVMSATKISFKKLFEHKIKKNLNRCPFIILAHDSIPDNQHPEKGFEMIVVNEIARKLNLQSLVNQISGNLFLVSWTPDQKPAGFLKLINDNEADVAFGALQRRFDFSMYSDYISSHLEDDLSWFVPTPKFLTSVEKFLNAFSATMWMWSGIILVVVLIFVLTTKVIAFGVSNTYSDIVLFTVGAYFYLPITIPTHNLYKFLFLLLYLFSMHIITMYQAGLIFMLSNKVTREPLRNIEQALERNEPFIFHEHTRHAINFSGSPVWAVLEKKKNYYFSIRPNTVEIAKTKRGVFLGPSMVMSKKIVEKHMFDSDGRVQLIALKSPFTTYPDIIAFSPGHPLVPAMDMIMLRLLQGGFCAYWYANYQTIKEAYSSAQENSPLSMEALSAIFMFAGSFLVVSCIFFFVEVAWPVPLRRESRITKKLMLILKSFEMYTVHELK